MSSPLWSFEELARFTRYEDAEVRSWAVDRLIHLFPERAPGAIADLLFDEHDTTPMIVADHLGAHGGEEQFPLLARGFTRGAGMLPGHCLAALARLGYEDAPRLAKAALHRRDLPEGALPPIVAGLAEMTASRGSEEAADAAREILLRRPELYAEPLALRGCLAIFGDDRLGDLVAKWVTALHFRGLEPAEAGIQAIQENLQMEDVSWCLRTDRSGRVDLERSLRSIENGYDCEVRSAIPEADRALLAAAFSRGEFREMARTLASLVVSRASAIAGASSDPGDTLPGRIAALASGFQNDAVLTEADRLGHAMHTWVISLLASALFKTAPYRNLTREADRVGGDLEALLALAETESSILPRLVPARLARAAGADGRARLEQWCVATLEARGPFFPKAVAIETLGEMGLTAHLPMLIDHLSDDNGYVFGAAERALARMGDEAIDAARAEMERRDLHPDAIHSILVVASDLMTQAALSLVLDRFDEFMEASGPEEGPELASLFGARDLIPHLRRWLKRSDASSAKVALQARVGHALLLVGGIHNVAIPEEEKILRAIDQYWREHPEEAGDDPEASGDYVM